MVLSSESPDFLDKGCQYSHLSNQYEPHKLK